jgi:hypothetical protein
MKIFLSIILGTLLLSTDNLYCQDNTGEHAPTSRIIRLDNFYSCYGVVFDSVCSLPIEIRNMKNRFNPIDSEIILAELVFLAQFNKANQSNASTLGTKILPDPKSYFSKFNRQYLGFIDSNGNKNLIIHLFDYSNKHIVNKFLGDSWKNKFVIFFSENMPFDILTYRINITDSLLYTTF